MITLYWLILFCINNAHRVACVLAHDMKRACDRGIRNILICRKKNGITTFSFIYLSDNTSVERLQIIWNIWQNVKKTWPILRTNSQLYVCENVSDNQFYVIYLIGNNVLCNSLIKSNCRFDFVDMQRNNILRQ